MFRATFSRLEMEARAEAMRLFHSAWLTAALRRGARPPRIPTRPVEAGGWAKLMATPEGRAWVEEFWDGALNHPDAA